VWAPDGRLYFEDSASGEVKVLDVKTGTASTFASGVLWYAPSISPDGHWVAYSTTKISDPTGQATVMLRDLRATAPASQVGSGVAQFTGVDTLWLVDSNICVEACQPVINGKVSMLPVGTKTPTPVPIGGSTALALWFSRSPLASPQPTPSGTKTAVFHAWNSDGTLAAGVQQRQVLQGTCTGGSEKLARGLRCTSGNGIFDPCFLSPMDPAKVACINSPWAGDADVLTLPGAQSPPPSQTDAELIASGSVWAIELTDSRRCDFATGATAAVGNTRLNYPCSDNSGLWGMPDRGQSPWSILYSPPGTQVDSDAFHANPGLKPVTIAMVWL
jgi:hypothetical protein